MLTSHKEFTTQYFNFFNANEMFLTHLDMNCNYRLITDELNNKTSNTTRVKNLHLYLIRSQFFCSLFLSYLTTLYPCTRTRRDTILCAFEMIQFFPKYAKCILNINKSLKHFGGSVKLMVCGN